MVETCPTLIRTGDAWRRHTQVCGRPIKRDGMCGIHAAAADRRRAGDEKRKAERDRATELAAEVERLTGIRPYVGMEYGALRIVTNAERFVVALRHAVGDQ